MTSLSKLNGLTMPSGSSSLGGCLVYLTANEAISSGYDRVYWDAELWDTDSYWSTTNSDRIIFPAAGRYWLHYNLSNDCGMSNYTYYVEWMVQFNIYDVSASSWLYPGSTKFCGVHYHTDTSLDTPFDNYHIELQTYIDIDTANDYGVLQTYFVGYGGSGTLTGSSSGPMYGSFLEIERVS